MWNSVGVSPSEQRLHLRSIGVTVRVQQVGDGDPVLFVHGASNSGTSWASIAHLLQGFRCLFLDRPGCGLSDPLPAPFGDVHALQHFSDVLLVDILDALGLEKAHLVATSYGGYAALRTAAAHPERVDRVVIFGWTMGAANPDLPWFMRMAAVPALAALMTALPVNERAVRSMFKRIGLRDAVARGRVSPQLISAYTSLLRDTDTMRNELEIGRWNMTWKGLNDEVVLSDTVLGRVKAPVYLLWGENDPFGPPDAARAFARKLPNATLELMPNAGHAVWIDEPTRAAGVIKRFLSTQNGTEDTDSSDGAECL